MDTILFCMVQLLVDVRMISPHPNLKRLHAPEGCKGNGHREQTYTCTLPGACRPGEDVFHRRLAEFGPWGGFFLSATNAFHE